MSSKEKIARDVADPEQRTLIVDAQIRTGLPLQLRAMREDRGWTQSTLAEKLGTTQNTVSRLENPKTSKPTITTLKRIARTFDVALVVKFAPFSEFIDTVGGMSRKSVAVPSYDQEAAADEQDSVESQLEVVNRSLGEMFIQADNCGLSFDELAQRNAVRMYGYPGAYPAAYESAYPPAYPSSFPDYIASDLPPLRKKPPKIEKSGKVIDITKGRPNWVDPTAFTASVTHDEQPELRIQDAG